MRKLLLFFLILIICAPQTITAQSPSLPADLVFTVSQTTDPNMRNSLAYLDAETMQTEIFYRDSEAAYMRALVWSPQGDRLAIARLLYDDGWSYVIEVCILTRTGEFQICLDDLLAADGLDPWQDFYYVTWSADGNSLFFSTLEDEDTLLLVGADVGTGERMQIVAYYDFDPMECDDFPILFWTLDLTYLVAIRSRQQAYVSTPPQLINLTTGEQYTIAPPRSLEDNELFMISSYSSFSPQGNFFAGYIIDLDEEEDWSVLLFDHRAEVVKVIVSDMIGLRTWQQDEQAFFSVVGTGQSQPQIVRYHIASDQLETIIDVSSFPGSPGSLVLSPDEQYLAFTMDRYDHDTDLHVASVEGELVPLDIPFATSSYPVWVPD